TDTWGVEVRPNETTEANQPWHWVVIPAMGLCMGEIFYLKDLAQDCADDGIYEFFFCGPPLIITGGTGSPLNPQAIKCRRTRHPKARPANPGSDRSGVLVNWRLGHLPPDAR